MQNHNIFTSWLRRSGQYHYRKPTQLLHIDWTLLVTLILLVAVGLIILYSASNQDMGALTRQATRIGIAFVLMFVLAQIPPTQYRVWTPWLYGLGLLLLFIVLAIGVIGKGAQRWLNLWFFQFQPSELMKLVVPMMIAWFLHDKQLPPSFTTLSILGAIILLPVLLIAKQPDLGTAVLVAATGFGMLFLAGISWALLGTFGVVAAASGPVIWHFMHNYQRLRVLTFLNPERDPLGAGYHIIQSKIAIGSGGIFGKGWLNGTQSHLSFLPEHATDFIFAVSGEEFGLIGGIILISLYMIVAYRGLYISINAQDNFSRLLAGGLSFNLFISAFVNIGMVTGILPVVGVPLPFVSYGGTSFITLIASFGMLMSLHTHRKLLAN